MIFDLSFELGLGGGAWVRPDASVTVFVPVIKYLTKETRRRKCLFLLVFGGFSPLLWTGHGSQSVRELTTSVCRQEAER